MKLFVLRDEDESPYDVSPELEGLSASAESSLQQRGYIRVHRAVMDACGAMPALLYGVLENLIQIGEQTGMGCVPSHRALGTALGTSIATAKRHLNTLREAGWIAWEGTDSGSVNRYWLPLKTEVAQIKPPLAQIKPPPAQKTLPPALFERPPSSNRATPQLKLSDNLERVNKQERVNDTPPLTPPGGELTPYALFALFCDVAELDIGGYSERDKGRPLAAAKRLIADGVSRDDVRGVVKWLKAQTWRTGVLTLSTVEQELGNWRAAGRPAPAVAAAKQGGYKSQADLNQGGRGVAMW